MKQLSEMTVQELFAHKDFVTQEIEHAQRELDMEALAHGRALMKDIDKEISRRAVVGATED